MNRKPFYDKGVILHFQLIYSKLDTPSILRNGIECINK